MHSNLHNHDPLPNDELVKLIEKNIGKIKIDNQIT